MYIIYIIMYIIGNILTFIQEYLKSEVSEISSPEFSDPQPVFGSFVNFHYNFI